MGKASSFVIQYDDLRDFVKPLRIFGHPAHSINSPAALETAQQNNLTFCTRQGDKALPLISGTKAGMVLCRDDIPALEAAAFSNCVFTVENPRLSFMKCLQKYFTPEKPVGVHPTAIIDEGVSFPADVYVGPMVHIRSGAKIGEGTVIEDRVYIGPNTVIGRNVHIQVGAVIGCKGQGFERMASGEFEKFPQLGAVLIKDNVEIGANSTVVCGTLFITQIGQGSKIGHLVNVAHNVIIGENVFVGACVTIAGSAAIGDNSWLAPQCCIRNKVMIGKNVTVGLGAVVVKDVADGLTVVGVPAKADTR